MRRFGEYGPQNPTGLGDHGAVNHSAGQYSEHRVIDLPGGGRAHFVTTTNHIEATWRQLKRSIKSSKQFLDDQNNVVRFVDGYIARYIYIRKR